MKGILYIKASNKMPKYLCFIENEELRRWVEYICLTIVWYGMLCYSSYVLPGFRK